LLIILALETTISGQTKKATISLPPVHYTAGVGISGVLQLGNCTGSDLTVDWGQKIMNCQSLLPSGGGTIDTSSFTGPQVCTTNVVLQPQVALRIYTGTHISGTCTITMSSDDSIEGVGATGEYVDPISSITWTYTGATGNLVNLAPNAYSVKLANIEFNGNPSGASGHGLFASPGPNYSPSNIGITLDHVTFRQFAQDGIHFEDNVYQVDCFRCAATENKRYGWFQSPVNSFIGPNQIDIFAGRFNRNGVAQVYGQGGTSTAQFHMWGGSISSELYPSAQSYCAQFEAGNNQQFDAFFNNVHFESCGGTSGGGAFILWDVLNGQFVVRDSYFVIPVGTADDVALGPQFGGWAVIGPGNSFATNSGGYSVDNQTPFLTSTAIIYDVLTESQVKNPASNLVFVNPLNITAHLSPNGWEDTLQNARLHFADPTAGGSDFFLENSQGKFSITDGQGNPFLQAEGGVIKTPALLEVGNHVNMKGASTDFAGTITLDNATSGTYTFSTPFFNNPVCLVTPTNVPKSEWSYNANGQALYIFATAPITANFKYICVGAPN
jgi:hypothetical protein